METVRQIYLDNGATSFPKPEAVYRGMEVFARTMAANPGRSTHRMAAESEKMITETRLLVSKLFGFEYPDRVVFTLNATDALNMALKGVLKQGDHVITSVLEHNSVSRPLNRLEQDNVITVTRIGAGANHVIDPSDVSRAFRANTRLVAITHASNVTGTVQPIGEIGKLTREREALFLVDASQSAGVVPIHMEKQCIDLLAFTGHKGLLGPTGTGGLLVNRRVALRPWREGGTGGDSSSPLQPTQFPHNLEGGTPNVFGLSGLREGVRILLDHGIEKILEKEWQLISDLYKEMRFPDKIQWYGADEAILSGKRGERIGLVSLNIDGLSPSELTTVLDQEFGIQSRSGLHCAPGAHRHLGTFPDGTVRLSVGFLNSKEDMIEAAAALDQIISEIAKTA